MQLKSKKDRSGILSRIFGNLGGIEIFFIAIAAAVIQFQIEGILLQAVAGTAVVWAVAAGFVYQGVETVKSFKIKTWIRNNGKLTLGAVLLVYSLVFYIIFNPQPSHAVLFTVQTAITTAITANVEANLAGILNNIIIVFLWMIRLAILGYLGQQALKIFNEREEENWVKLIKTPAIFLVTIGVINTIATYVSTGTFGGTGVGA